MRLRGLAALAVGALGVDAYNRRVRIPQPALEPQLAAEPEMWRWRFGDVAVYRAGDPSNPPLVLLHGHNAAASAGEMCQPFQRLSDRYQVFAPDLLGYGRSDRPSLRYRPDLYIELIEALLREVVQRPAAVVASSLTSAHTIEVAAENPEWITSLVLICPTGVRNLSMQPLTGTITEELFRLPLIGETLFNGLASRPSIRYFLEGPTYFRNELVTKDLVERYYRTAHVTGARYAPAAFVSGKLYHDASDAWTRLEQRVLIIWGKEARFTPVSDASPFLATNPAAELQVINDSGSLPHDEQPEQFAAIVAEWLESNRQ